ncbi:GMC oxidoreductase [Aspergillus sclerotiicarbonarius CBS 121057]|uniref:glucose oxidase n=1 Tax=Aspergillus sclerotiicarbonarius (strain CBS 121057 / IBT 28362) TaxID=1448318 RepID=A0A319EP14_ASPSB|nr:GMC oxidoreductase [Aspergillus sclerotiicarbonarius CBS 121057]
MFYHILLGILIQTSVQATHYDYVIIGGGTCGLTVANRLSSHPNTTVAIVEPGKDEHDNPNVTSVLGFGRAFNTSMDWQYLSTDQTYAANQRVEYHSGKAWGGSSTINGLTYIRAQNVHIDAWETLGNTGWNWSTLYPYYLQSEMFQIPSPAQMDAGASYIPYYHGWNGPVNVGYPFELNNGSLASLVNLTWQNLGFEFNPDPNGGQVEGFSVWPLTVDRDMDVRADAARAYYYPVRDRANLGMIQGLVNRILWQGTDSTEGDALAGGVEYTAPDGSVKRLYANREVILSAGSIRTPAILELSGVGNPNILTKHDIPIRIPLPSVGENAQDQPNNIILYPPRNPNTTNGILPYATFATASDLFGPNLSSIANTTLASIPTWAVTLSQASNSAISIPSLTTQLLLQHSLIFTDQVPCAEIFTTKIDSSLASSLWPLLPFSRGSVHITSPDPQIYPAIDPKFFIINWDTALQIRIAELAGAFWDTPPVEWIVGERVFPFPGVEVDGAWLKSNCNHHLIGTAIMLPRELGGVVDTNLRVYGTGNLRVVDASMLPMQLSGHLTSTLYAVAERAAELIMDEW